MGLVNTIHFVNLLALEGVGQHKLIYILCPSWHGMGLVITSCDIFCGVASIGRVCSTNVEMRFLSSVAWEEFSLNMLIIIFCPPRHGMSLYYTC